MKSHRKPEKRLYSYPIFTGRSPFFLSDSSDPIENPLIKFSISGGLFQLYVFHFSFLAYSICFATSALKLLIPPGIACSDSCADKLKENTANTIKNILVMIFYSYRSVAMEEKFIFSLICEVTGFPSHEAGIQFFLMRLTTYFMSSKK